MRPVLPWSWWWFLQPLWTTIAAARGGEAQAISQSYVRIIQLRVLDDVEVADHHENIAERFNDHIEGPCRCSGRLWPGLAVEPERDPDHVGRGKAPVLHGECAYGFGEVAFAGDPHGARRLPCVEVFA